MFALSVPCHSCGVDNPATAFDCGNPDCRAVIRLRVVTSTQVLPTTTDLDSKTIDLVREAYLVSALLSQSAYRLLALLQAPDKSGKA